ncbi:methyltransferase [Cryobacterium sp. PH31-L1]|uniref:class I SAM-dependent methyltransferase n=1 Tax=Cryobacterium sp. PH31-L1 TaxID=3046199 RepID=UPI0024B8EE88|nr:methyltransferase [Cryobacterium sp. PH31-L1]MDJ0379017.1 methyltransferase domain-containing protein [Cryobacterium sp. PH31-L1]
MTHTHSSHDLSNHERLGHGILPEHDSVLPELLALDAALGAPMLATALDAAGALLEAEPLRVIDLGAGTGTGTIALATRFPNARIHSLDASFQMLERLIATAEAAGVADQVGTHLVDLDGDWSDIVPPGVDLAWAALSLHHMTDPEEVLRQVFEVLRPGGVLVVTEFTDVTTYDPADLGTGRNGLGARVVNELAAHGYPATAEWTTVLETAGFAAVERTASALTASALTPDGARYLEVLLARHRALISENLSREDLAALDDAIATLCVGTSRLQMTSGRAFWTAIRPTNDDPNVSAARDGANPIARAKDTPADEARR